MVATLPVDPTPGPQSRVFVGCAVSSCVPEEIYVSIPLRVLRLHVNVSVPCVKVSTLLGSPLTGVCEAALQEK